MPATLIIRLASLCVASSMAFAALASHARDSLRYVLEADAPPQERVSAMLRIAARRAYTDPKGSADLLDDATVVARMAGDSALVHEALVAVCDAQLRVGNRLRHMSASMQALRIAKHLGQAEWIALDLQSIARAYRKRDEPERAISEARNSLAIALNAGATKLKQGAEVLLLESLIDAGRLADAHRLATSALSDGQADKTHIARVQVLLARILLAHGKPFDARPLLLAAEQTLASVPDPEGVLAARISLCEVATAAGNLSEARSILQKLSEDKSHSQPERATVIRLNHGLALAAGDFRAAHDYLTALNASEDSTRRIDRDLLLSGMHAHYDLELKELDNSQLKKDNTRHQTDLASALEANEALIAAIAALAVLTGMLVVLLLKDRRSSKRSRLKSAVITRQRDELEAKKLELEHQNLRLREALLNGEQKDLIIREIHHRVKNNLQVIDGLLTLHIGQSSDPQATKAIREARGRIAAMALVHQAIHKHGGEEGLPLAKHFSDLARLVLVAHGRHDSISANVNAEGDQMDAEELLPLSLLVNELITNSIKHALPSGTHGAITLSIGREPGHGWLLRYADDGVAHAGQQGASRPDSVGMGLIQCLADQLEGQLEASFEHGTRITFRFGEASRSVARRAS